MLLVAGTCLPNGHYSVGIRSRGNSTSEPKTIEIDGKPINWKKPKKYEEKHVHEIERKKGNPHGIGKNENHQIASFG